MDTPASQIQEPIVEGAKDHTQEVVLFQTKSRSWTCPFPRHKGMLQECLSERIVDQSETCQHHRFKSILCEECTSFHKGRSRTCLVPSCRRQLLRRPGRAVTDERVSLCRLFAQERQDQACFRARSFLGSECHCPSCAAVLIPLSDRRALHRNQCKTPGVLEQKRTGNVAMICRLALDFLTICAWVKCVVNSFPHRASFTRANFSRACFRCTSCIFLLCVVSKTDHPRAHVMFRTMLDPAPLSSGLSIPTSSSLLFNTNRKNPCAPQSGVLLGRFAEQFPLTGYEPNALVEVSSTEVTTTLLPSRKASIGSTYNTGEDIATTPAVSEVDERSDLGNAGLTSVNTGERKKCEPTQNLSLL